MTVESNYVISKPIAPCTRDFSLASSELQVIGRIDCDWFIVLAAPVVIGRSSALVSVFRQSFKNRCIAVAILGFLAHKTGI